MRDLLRKREISLISFWKNFFILVALIRYIDKRSFEEKKKKTKTRSIKIKKQGSSAQPAPVPKDEDDDNEQEEKYMNL